MTNPEILWVKFFLWIGMKKKEDTDQDRYTKDTIRLDPDPEHWESLKF